MVYQNIFKENRNGLIEQGDLTSASGDAERKAVPDILPPHSLDSTPQVALDDDKADDATGFVANFHQACAFLNAILHAAPHPSKKCSIRRSINITHDVRLYFLSIKHRKRI